MTDFRERRTNMNEQFDRLADMITENHTDVVQRLTTIETNWKNDRKDLDELKTQCDDHDDIITKGKGIFALGSVVGLGGIYAAYQWLIAHLPKAAK